MHNRYPLTLIGCAWLIILAIVLLAWISHAAAQSIPEATEPPVPEMTVTPYLEPPVHWPPSTPQSEETNHLWLPMVTTR